MTFDFASTRGSDKPIDMAQLYDFWAGANGAVVVRGFAKHINGGLCLAKPYLFSSDTISDASTA